MQEPVTAPWGLIISETDFEKLKAGFQPQNQDDKWRVTMDQSNGVNISIHLARTGTGKEVYVLHVKSSEADSSSGVRVDAITWEQNRAGIRRSEGQAKKEVVIIARGLLDCDFDELPQYDVSDLWNYPAA